MLSLAALIVREPIRAERADKLQLRQCADGLPLALFSQLATKHR